MNNSIKFVVLVVAFASGGALGGKGGSAFAARGEAEDDFEDEPASAEAQDFEGLEDTDDEYQMPVRQWKRGEQGSFGFWSPHPSDYNPMRRPFSGQSLRSNKKSSSTISSDDIMYQTIPGSSSIPGELPVQNQNGLVEDTLETFLDDLREKRKSPANMVLVKLRRMNKGSSASRGRKLSRRRANTLPYAMKFGTVNVKSSQGIGK